MKTEEKIERIIYWWMRYTGIRCGEQIDSNGKVWRAQDIRVLQSRLKAFWKNPKKFNFNMPDMGIDEQGFLREGEEDA